MLVAFFAPFSTNPDNALLKRNCLEGEDSEDEILVDKGVGRTARVGNLKSASLGRLFLRALLKTDTCRDCIKDGRCEHGTLVSNLRQAPEAPVHLGFHIDLKLGGEI